MTYVTLVITVTTLGKPKTKLNTSIDLKSIHTHTYPKWGTVDLNAYNSCILYI